jgi:predicted dehydrogenase
MKKIGFIDFYLDEWHANRYPEWIRDDITANVRDFELAFAWAEQDSPSGLSTREWGEANGVEVLATLEELVERSDCLVLLAPNHPEHHERLAQLPLKSGKSVYMDKTFSPDLRTGIRMFELAEKHRTPLFSSSALRFTEELAKFPNDVVNADHLEFVATTGAGTFEVYAVHQLEMIVSLMGCGAQRIKSLSTPHGNHLIVEYEKGRQASMLQMRGAPFQVAMQCRNGNGVFIGQCSNFFPRLIHEVLDFFETGKPPILKEETLEIMALIEAGRAAIAKRDTWIPVRR